MSNGLPAHQQEDSNIFYLRTRDKSDGTGKEIDWIAIDANNSGNAPAPAQQVAQQQVNNYTQPGQTGQSRQ